VLVREQQVVCGVWRKLAVAKEKSIAVLELLMTADRIMNCGLESATIYIYVYTAHGNIRHLQSLREANALFVFKSFELYYSCWMRCDLQNMEVIAGY